MTSKRVHRLLRWYWHGKGLLVITGANCTIGLVCGYWVLSQIIGSLSLLQALPIAFVIGTSIASILSMAVAMFNLHGPYVSNE